MSAHCSTETLSPSMMNDERAIKQLEKIKNRIKHEQDLIRRRRWRESEKAMALTSCESDIAAINFAIENILQCR